MEELKKLREEIDKIDSQIMTLLQERFGVGKQIGELKKQNDIPFLQKNRWEKLLENRIQMAWKLGLDKDMIKTMWNAIHISSLKEQGKD